MSSRSRRATALALIILVLSTTPAGPYLWDLVDDHVDVPYLRDCRGLHRHASEC